MSLTPELQLEAQQLARREKIAQMLMQHGMQGASVPQQGRIASRMSPLQPLAQLATGVAGVQMEKRNDAASADLGHRYENFLQSGVQDYMRARNGTGVQPDPQEFSQSQDLGTPPPAPASPSNNPRELAASALMSRNPMVQQLGKMDYEHQQKLDLPHTLAPGGSLVSGRGAPLASTPPLHQIPENWKNFLPADAIRQPNDPAGIFRLKGPDGQADVYSIEFEGSQPKGYKRLDNGPNPNQGSTLRKHYTLVHTAQGTVAVNDQDPNDVKPIVTGGKPVVQVSADPKLAGAKAAEAAAGKQEGTVTEQQRLTLQKTVQEAELGLKRIDELVGTADGATKPHPGFSSTVGWTWTPGMRLVEGSKESDFMKRLDQVKGGAFLQAYNTLKGGGQITEIEGVKGTDAITRMSKATSEKEFVSAARELQSIVKQGVERAKQLAAQSPRAPAAITPPPDGFQPL